MTFRLLVLLAMLALPAAASAGPREKVIEESELGTYLDEGWVSKMPVNGSRFIVERA